MAKGGDFVYGLLLVCLVLYEAQTQDEDKTLNSLVQRLRLLEKRLHMEIAMLRQEFQSDLLLMPTLPKANNSDVGNRQDIDIKDKDIDAEISALEKRLTDVLNSMKMGFATEKVYRRDLQEQIKRISEDNGTIKDSMKALLNTLISKMSIYGDLQEQMKRISDENGATKESLISKIDVLVDSFGVIGDALRAGHMTKQDPPQDCADALRQGHTSSGVYTIHPDTMWRPLNVYCDMETDDGGWTVFQRRMDGSEDFFRTWMDYRFGFGNLTGEFWLGNEYIHRLVARAPHELRIELEDFENDRRFAKYLIFSVGSVENGFKLSYEGFVGNVSDSLKTHNGMQFSTKDKGPSKSCANQYKGGFWYEKCHGVNINGLYLKGKHESYADGVNWHGFKGHNYSLKFTEMKFRPK